MPDLKSTGTEQYWGSTLQWAVLGLLQWAVLELLQLAVPDLKSTGTEQYWGSTLQWAILGLGQLFRSHIQQLPAGFPSGISSSGWTRRKILDRNLNSVGAEVEILTRKIKNFTNVSCYRQSCCVLVNWRRRKVSLNYQVKNEGPTYLTKTTFNKLKNEKQSKTKAKA